MLLTAIAFGALIMHTGVPITLSGGATVAMPHMPGSPTMPHAPSHGGSGGHHADSVCLATTPVGQGTGSASAGGSVTGPGATTSACLDGTDPNAGRLAGQLRQPPPRPPDLVALGVLRL